MKNIITLSLRELDNLFSSEKIENYELVHFKLIDTHAHSMNIGYIYRIVIKYLGNLYMQDLEFDYGINDDMWFDYIENSDDDNLKVFLPCKEINVIDYEIVDVVYTTDEDILKEISSSGSEYLLNRLLKLENHTKEYLYKTKLSSHKQLDTYIIKQIKKELLSRIKD